MSMTPTPAALTPDQRAPADVALVDQYLTHRCRDKVTGFTGICTGVVFYATGCAQALLVPPVDSTGKPQDAQWYDLQRVDVLERHAVRLENGETPGPDRAAPGGHRGA